MISKQINDETLLLSEKVGAVEFKVKIYIKNSIEETVSTLSCYTLYPKDYIFVDAQLDIYWDNKRALLFDTATEVGNFIPYTDRFFSILEKIENKEMEISDICQLGKVSSKLRENIFQVLSDNQQITLLDSDYDRLLNSGLSFMSSKIPGEIEVGCFLYNFESVAYIEVGDMDIDGMDSCSSFDKDSDFVAPIDVKNMKKMVLNWKSEIETIIRRINP